MYPYDLEHCLIVNENGALAVTVSRNESAILHQVFQEIFGYDVGRVPEYLNIL